MVFFWREIFIFYFSQPVHSSPLKKLEVFLDRGIEAVFYPQSKNSKGKC